eukprot:m.318239 g.318239  ORF g.318239 m.318239 type:complete len:129 (+) comp16444_c0_seq9:2235-2621(+)
MGDSGEHASAQPIRAGDFAMARESPTEDGMYLLQVAKDDRKQIQADEKAAKKAHKAEQNSEKQARGLTIFDAIRDGTATLATLKGQQLDDLAMYKNYKWKKVHDKLPKKSAKREQLQLAFPHDFPSPT